MIRVKRGWVAHKRRKEVLKFTKGYIGRSSNCYRIAIGRFEKALKYSYRDRRVKKRIYRRLWISTINSAVRKFGIKYSVFIYKIYRVLDIKINRKMLYNIIVNEFSTFTFLCEFLKKSEEKYTS